MDTEWAVGFSIALAIVVVVVVLLIAMIVLASRAADKAEAILDALDDARVNTAGLWAVDATNQAATRIVAAATAAREHLETEGSMR